MANSCIFDEVAMVFQDPTTSLNPAFTVGSQIAEVLRARKGMSRKQAWTRAVELIDRVGTPRPQERARAYPHELSGGMAQRIAGARRRRSSRREGALSLRDAGRKPRAHPRLYPPPWSRKPGDIHLPTLGFKVDGKVIAATVPPPELGADTHAVLRELGYSEADLCRLAGEAVI